MYRRGLRRLTGNKTYLFGLIIVHDLSSIVPRKTNPAPWFTITLDDRRLGSDYGYDSLVVKFENEKRSYIFLRMLYGRLR